MATDLFLAMTNDQISEDFIIRNCLKSKNAECGAFIGDARVIGAFAMKLSSAMPELL